MQETHITTNGAAPMQAETMILPAGNGAWDVTVYPFGGDFIRPRENLTVRNVRPSAKAGYMLADAEYDDRRGVRTICSNKFVSAEDVAYLAGKLDLSAIDPDDIRAELKECGAWDAEELSDDDANKRRIIWIAAGNIKEEEAAK